LLVPRTYVLYTGSDSAADILAQVGQYAGSGLTWDIVLCFRDGGMELDGWLRLIRAIVRQYGSTSEHGSCGPSPMITSRAPRPAGGE